jgi:hypothetical protein
VLVLYHGLVSVDELPSTVKSLNNSWPPTYQTSITVVCG